MSTNMSMIANVILIAYKRLKNKKLKNISFRHKYKVFPCFGWSGFALNLVLVQVVLTPTAMCNFQQQYISC